jgi:hypothetical protein
MHSVLKFRCDTVCSCLLHPCTFRDLTLTFGNVSFYSNVWWQFSAVRYDAQHYCALLFLAATTSSCNILSAGHIEGNFKIRGI